MTEASRPLKVAIAGFGTVGRAVARVLCEGRHPELRLAAIATRRPDAARRDPAGIPATVTVTGDIDALLGGEADVLVELIGGLEPARTWIAAALQSGRAVVTANKQVIAEHGPGLFSLARACGSPLRFEAAVAGAVPVIRGLQDGLAGDRVTRIAGVVNGTCNFVLGRMADSGMSLDDAVREAQTRGLAEADPAADRARPYYVRISSARLRSASSPADLLDGAGIEIDRVLAHANGRSGRWAAVVRPCRPMDLARALTALAPAGGTGGTIVSLPLFDVE